MPSAMDQPPMKVEGLGLVNSRNSWSCHPLLGAWVVVDFRKDGVVPAGFFSRSRRAESRGRIVDHVVAVRRGIVHARLPRTASSGGKGQPNVVVSCLEAECPQMRSHAFIDRRVLGFRQRHTRSGCRSRRRCDFGMLHVRHGAFAHEHVAQAPPHFSHGPGPCSSTTSTSPCRDWRHAKCRQTPLVAGHPCRRFPAGCSLGFVVVRRRTGEVISRWATFKSPQHTTGLSGRVLQVTRNAASQVPRKKR